MDIPLWKAWKVRERRHENTILESENEAHTLRSQKWGGRRKWVKENQEERSLTMAMTTTIIKKNANLSIAGVRTRECVSPQDMLKGTSKAKAGKLHKERAGRKQLLLVFLRERAFEKHYHIPASTTSLETYLDSLPSLCSHSFLTHSLSVHCARYWTRLCLPSRAHQITSRDNSTVIMNAMQSREGI